MATYQETMAYLAKAYGGYTNPWQAKLDPRNGEAAYTELMAEHLDRELAVIEAGCGHGVEALAIAGKVASLTAFDFSPEMIALARAAAGDRAPNLTFVEADCSPSRGGRIPADDRSADLIVSRRGPTSFIPDAARVLRPGGAMIQVAYMATPVPAWNDELPPELRMQDEPETIPDRVLDQLAAAGIALHSAWTFDVPELFDAPEELHKRLVWDRKVEGLPDYAQVQGVFEALFERHACEGGLTLRQRRYLWKAVV